jgi:capsular polysaccharide biosynthesis protein
MNEFFSTLLDKVSSILEKRKGLLPIVGIICVTINFVLQLMVSNWCTQTNLFLHIGIVVTILGFLLAWAL